ncbi:MAG: phosphate ABC transporter substrate-binding protein [Cellulosilyticaceae bacterium]
MLRNKLIVGLSTVLLGSLLFTGCGSKEVVGAKITTVGSTTVAVPMEALADTYKEKNPDVVIEVQGVGSSAGVKAAHEKTADIGMASREIKDSEKEYGLKETVIAFDGIAMVIHPSNGVSNLTKEQVKDIFNGTVTNWSEVGGADQAIVVVTREDGSGTRSAFEEIVGLTEKRDDKEVSTIVQTALVAEGNGAIRANVASKEGAIGFVSLGYIDETVKAVSIDGVVPTVEGIKDGSYTISRPLLILTQPEVSQDVQAFVDFILSPEGQEVVSDKYIPVN